MKYTIAELDCQLNTIINYCDTDDIYEAECAYQHMKNDADKLRYSEVIFLNKDTYEYMHENF